MGELTAEAICELILKQLHHPDFSAMKNEARQTLPDSTANQIHDKVLERFKQTLAHRTLAEEMAQTRNTLCNLFPRMVDQNAIHAALSTLFERAGLTGLDSTHSSSFGKQTLNVLELTCLRLKQLAHFARVVQQNPSLVTGKEPTDTLQAAVRNIAEEAAYCAPGLIQKTEDSFTEAKLRLFPPSLESKVGTLRHQICRQVIRDFCEETHSHESTYNGSEVHYVAAWQNKLRAARIEYAFLPEINDIYAPNLPDDVVHQANLEKLSSMLDKQANLSKVFVNIGLEVLNELRSTLGDRSSELSKHYPAFKDMLRALNTRYEVLKESDLVEFESDELGIKLTNKSERAAIRLVANFMGELFVPKTVINNKAQSVYEHEALYWTGTEDPNNGGPIYSVSLEDLTKSYLDEALTHPGDNIHPSTDLLLEALLNSNPASIESFANSAQAKKYGLDSLCKVHPSCIADKAGTVHTLAIAVLHHEHLNNPQTESGKRLGFSLKAGLETLAKRNIPLSYFDPKIAQFLVTDFAKQTTDIAWAIRAATMWNNAEIMDALLNELQRTERISVSDTKLYKKAADWAGSIEKMAARASLLKHIGALNTNTDEFGYVLHHLIVRNDLSGVRFALENGVSPNVKTSRSYSKISALRLAIGYGHAGIVCELIKQGANLQETWVGATRATMNPLLLAELSEKRHMAQLLRDAGATQPAGQADTSDPILRAIEGQRYSTAARLLHERGNINQKFYKDKTILHLAARGGDVATIQYAATHGANVNARTSQLTDGKTPLIVAVKYGRIEAVRTLLELGANPLLRFGGERADHYAHAKGQTQMANMIRQAIEDRNQANRARNRARINAVGDAIHRLFN